jgi:PAS domain S-box-containing protein
MKPEKTAKDPALPVMVMDILSNVLSRADNPGDMDEYVAGEIRELTGARCILVIQSIITATGTEHRVVCVNPARRREWAESPATRRLYEIVHNLAATRLIRAEESSEISGYLRQEGFELSMAIPFGVGDLRMGAMLILGLPDERHIDSVMNLLDNLSTIVALVLRNAFLYESLRTSEERYALAVQGSHDGIWDQDLSSGEVYYSPRWKGMLGYEDDEIPNDVEEWKKLIHPDDYPMVMDALNGYLGGRIPAYEVEYRLRHKDGSYRCILARGICVRDSDCVPYRWAGSHTDVTEKKRAKDALIQSEKKFRTLFEESRDTILLLDCEERFVDSNRAGMELFGYSKEDLLSLSPSDLYRVPAHRERLWNDLRSCGFINDLEVEMKRKDGETIIVHLSASTVKDDAGRISGYQAIIHDMTERQRLERQLLQSQKMESIGILAGGVAHDFNNLLTAISGYGHILLESLPEDDELSKESVGTILKAADQAAELTKGLLAFSRHQVINPKPVNIDILIGNTGRLLQRIIGEDIEFSAGFSGRNLIIRADPGQIEQVLMNLATNARDAMPHGGRLSITTRPVVVKEGSEALCDLPAPGEYALISVADTGSGIDGESLGKIFEPFFTTKEVGKGTGLGLAIVYGIIKQHNGSIFAVSKPGKGSVFTIYLPLIEGRSDKEELKISAPPSGGSETLLLVEDEVFVIMFIKKILDRAGYNVIVADNGDDAVARFRENDDIALVLSDVVMPGKNGKETLDEIREIKPGIKAVFISGYPIDVMQKKGMFEEGVEIVTKPFDKDDILRKVREVLDKD